MELLIFIICIIVLILVIVGSISYYEENGSLLKEKESEYIGRVGERATYGIMSRMKECEYILTNLYIKTAKGGTTEIDLIAFTNRGLLVLETKNYSGIIHGDEDSEQWYASVYSQDNYFYNPIQQNETHIKYLQKSIGLNIPIYSIIVFSDRCSLEYIQDHFKDAYICQMSSLKKTIEDLFSENTESVSTLVLSSIYSRLEKYTNVSEEVIKKHKDYVKSKH